MFSDCPPNSCQYHGEAGQVEDWDDFGGNTRLYHSLRGRPPGNMTSSQQTVSPCNTDSILQDISFQHSLKNQIKSFIIIDCVVFYFTFLLLRPNIFPAKFLWRIHVWYGSFLWFQSEYPSDYDLRRKYISGLSGSYGILI